jgi:hypothetical protein
MEVTAWIILVVSGHRWSKMLQRVSFIVFVIR